MTPAIHCKDDKVECPYYDVCIARRNDRTVVGCGIYLYESGIITKEEIGVIHQIKEGEVKDEKRERIKNRISIKRNSTDA